ncbi:MAG: hypothetical protein PHN54_02555 [Bacilli bacterium]|jgi:hypothetical protein|nr:hypothetical protein [Bacilli bacterium]
MEQSILNVINEIIYFPFEILIGILVILLFLHAFLSFSIKTIADKKQIKNSWISFLPIFNTFIIGNIAFKKRIMSYALLVFSLLSTIYLIDVYNTFHFIFTLIVVFLSIILYFTALYNIYKMFCKKYVLLFIFTVITFGLISPIVFLCIRNNEYIDRS